MALIEEIIILEFNTPYNTEINTYINDIINYHGYSKPILGLLWTRFTSQVMMKEKVKDKDKEEIENPEDKKNTDSDKYFNKDDLSSKFDLLRTYMTQINSEKRSLRKTTIGKFKIFKINTINRGVARRAKKRAIEFLKNNTSE